MSLHKRCLDLNFGVSLMVLLLLIGRHAGQKQYYVLINNEVIKILEKCYIYLHIEGAYIQREISEEIKLLRSLKNRLDKKKAWMEKLGINALLYS